MTGRSLLADAPQPPPPLLLRANAPATFRPPSNLRAPSPQNKPTNNGDADGRVFCTPVMVSVAKNFEAPIKLLFPRTSLRAAYAAGAAPQFAMLGLGDIVLPGLFVALCLRYDAERRFKSAYFQVVFWAYCGGVAATILVMNVFKAAQPALLYIVPATLGAAAGAAALRGELRAVWDWEEAPPEGGSEDGGEGSEDKTGGGSGKAAAAVKKAAAGGGGRGKAKKVE